MCNSYQAPPLSFSCRSMRLSRRTHCLSRQGVPRAYRALADHFRRSAEFRTQRQVSVNIKTVLVYACWVDISPYIYPGAVVVAVGAPDKVVPPQLFAARREPPGEKCERCSDGAREPFAGKRRLDILGTLCTCVIKYIFSYQMPFPVERGLRCELLVKIPILIVHAGLGDGRICAEAFTQGI